MNRHDLKVFGTDGSDCCVTGKELTGSADDGDALTVSTGLAALGLEYHLSRLAAGARRSVIN
ncbi:hypothetical protein [Nocardia cyriacigeorgica]|uniref:hypothetical protein n=1 Tax=Nocardia cyriacigeorgica TaxID=135487 RepID=UPI002455AE0F|nr:hypothetical protein [Nocardia cyriacigeorgica]